MIGNKAANLQILRDNGMTVPEFYVITYEFVRKINDKVVQKRLVEDFDHWKKEHDISYAALRSSANGEDSINRSYAGQFLSLMKIESEKKFIQAIKKIAKSTPRDDYAETGKVAMNIIVQRYIEPEYAGVLFTVNPSNGAHDVVIEAVDGHGSKAVDGGDVSVYYYDRISNDIRSRRTEKTVALGKDYVTQLSVVSIDIEKLFGVPQDIEWAIAKGRIYILQSRTITSIHYLKAWDNANIGESFPGIVLPLTFSIARRGYELVYKSQAYEGGLTWYQLESHHRSFHDMIGLFNGRIYYNLASWYRFIALFPGNNTNQKFLDDQLQTAGDIVYLPPSSYPLRQKFAYYLRLAKRVVVFDREKAHYWRRIEQMVKKYNDLPSGKSLQILMQRYVFIEKYIVPHMGRSADNDFFVMIYHGIMKAKMAKWFGEDSVLATQFIGALHDVISSRQAELLNQIARFVNSDTVATKYLNEGKYEALDEYLLTTAAKESLAEYRSVFLHRFAGDQKIESENPLLKLEGFYSMVSAYAKMDDVVFTNRHKKALTAEAKRHKDVLSKLSFMQRLYYRFLLGRLKKHLRIREQNRLIRGKMYALLRELFPEVGAVLVESSYIEKPEDVHYLDIEEIFHLIDGSNYGDDMKVIIAGRKARYKQYQAESTQTRFITTGLTDHTYPRGLLLSNRKKHQPHKKSLAGTISSPGTVSGRVIVLDEPVIPNEPFDILVVAHTDPGWTPLIALAKGIIVEHGGILSHAAIVTRELGIPSIIGVEGATSRLHNGMKVTIDSLKSTVDIDQA
jgi:rifampicin phosphotransferase